MSTADTTKPFRCDACSRGFKTQAALDAHRATSKKHRHKLHKCNQCSKKFHTSSALSQHMEAKGHIENAKANTNSVGHGVTSSSTTSSAISIRPGFAASSDNDLPTALANKGDSLGDDLAASLEVLDLSATGSDAPLDRFFTSFSGFKYDSLLQPSTSFAQLQSQLRRRLGHEEMHLLRKSFHVAIDSELEQAYGRRQNLIAWQKLCEIVKGPTEAQSITACKKILQSMHVNIFDLVHNARQHSLLRGDGLTLNNNQADGTPNMRIFSSIKDLKKYSKEQKKVFPLVGGARMNGDRSAALKAFLRHFKH